MNDNRKPVRISTILIVVALIIGVLLAMVLGSKNTANQLPPKGAPAATAVLTSYSPPVSYPLFSGKQRYSHTGSAKASARYYNIYTENNSKHWTQLRLTRKGNVYLPAFTVVNMHIAGWNFPNIGQGANHGMAPSPTLGRKTWYPVRVSHDGDPYTTLTDHLIWQGNWQAGFDIWTEPRYDPSGRYQQYGGTELMVLNAVSRRGDPVNRGLPGYPRGSVYVNGKWWNVSAAVTGSGAKRWHRIYFILQHQSSTFSGPLNPFLAAAERYKMLSASDYITGIEYGFEINQGGIGMAVNSYDLRGVASATAQHARAFSVVPRVTGLRQSTAVAALHRAGFTVRLLTPYRRGHTLVTVTQNVPRNSLAQRGTTVAVRSR